MSEPISMAEMITLTIDGAQVSVPKGTLAIRAAEAAGVAIPRFCDHPLLDPAGACRQCLVEIPDAGNGRGFPKPQPSCTTEAANGMVIKTQATSQMAKDAQEQILELLLLNHPLDCPICDKGGECPLQNQALADGRANTRFDGVKRTYPKPIPLSDLILLDRERCVLCARCTRFSDQISGDPMINLVERGAKSQIGIYPDEPYDSYFSGNVTQICPVGALTSADYRFSARPFDLTSTVTTCENCASGCQIRVDARRGVVRRRLAGENAEVNEEWSCDRGRFGFVSGHQKDRLTRPMVRKSGELVPVSWPEAIEAAVTGLKRARLDVGVLTGGRLTVETNYAYSRFARAVLHTNSIDFRSRSQSAEEAQFLAQHVAGRAGQDCVTYADLEKASKVVLVSFEPEDESPMVFLRLRKANRKKGLKIVTIAAYASRGAAKMGAELIPARPSDVPQAIRDLDIDKDAIILAGVPLTQIPGSFTALADKVAESGARLAWVPRRAGEIGALEAGCLPTLLPSGHLVSDDASRDEMSEVWGSRLPSTPGLSALELLQAASEGNIKALVTAGIEARDFLDPDAALAGFEKAFVVSLENRMSDVAALANVVLPVDLLETTEGTFLNWEHRVCPVDEAVPNPRAAMTDIRVLAALAEGLGKDLGFRTAAAARIELASLPTWTGPREPMTPVAALEPGRSIQLVTWRELLDDSRCLDGADALLATAREVVARISPQTLRDEGLATSTYVRLTGTKGSVVYPIRVEPTMVDGAIWVPFNPHSWRLNQTGLGVGANVILAAAPAPTKEGE
ncbi:MAG: NADH-quinone oxidoreductase subunit G [Propionibacteriaceae bacterium]|jgi:NADH-quinone oxidoreductase subunit G|nr:NADH-quinone oxidoreductase subunit G [Propionibacteriaceae bacterium]